MSNENKDYENNVENNEEMALDDEQRVRTLSPTALVMKRFIRNRLAITGMIFIIAMFIFSYIGGWLMPYGEKEVFTKYEAMYKVYAGITVNEELKYVTKEGEEFPGSAVSQFVLALSDDTTNIFTAGEQTYIYEKADDDYYSIYSLAEIGKSLEFVGDIAIEVEDDSLGDAFDAAAKAAIKAEESTFEVDGVMYSVAYGNKSNTLFVASPIVAVTKNVYDFHENGIERSYEFVKAYEDAIRAGAETIEVNGVTYSLQPGDGLVEIYDGDLLYANISRYQIEPFYEDSFFGLEFKEAIRAAVEEGVDTFTFDEDGTGEQVFRLYRQNLQWTLEHEESTYLVDEYAFPSSTHLLGTDGAGMDILTRLMFGGRISLRIGFIVVGISTLIGIVLGGVAGYFGKFWDNLIMRIVDVFNCIPSLPLYIILGSIMDHMRVDPQVRLNVLMLVLAVLGWPGIARMVRGQTLSLREQEFMTATEATGIRVSKRIFKHLIPNIIPQLIVICTLSLGSVILTESVLSFLGVGVKFPFASWGNIINAVSNVHVMSNYLFVWIPAGVCILITVLGFNFIGDGLRDAFDPKGKR